MTDRQTEDIIIRKQSTEKLWSAFNKLATNQKIAIGDIYLEDQKLEDVGKTLKKSIGSVRFTRDSGLKKIRNELKRLNIEKSDF